MKIAVIGANGFVGKNLVKVLKKKYKLIKITRKTKFLSLKNDFDIIIHAANSSKKYEASKNPRKDFINSVGLTKKIVNFFKNKKIILISSISVRNENVRTHLKACERIQMNPKEILHASS